MRSSSASGRKKKKTPLQLALAQGRQYASQGRAVERAANRQRAAAQRRTTTGGGFGAARDYMARQRPAPSQIAGPPTPSPQRLRQIRARNERAATRRQQLRTSRQVARVLAREGRRAKVSGPPTPSYATRRPQIEAQAKRIEAQAKREGRQTTFGGTALERARFAVRTKEQQAAATRAELKRIGEKGAAQQAAIVGDITRPVKKVGEAIGRKAKGPAVWTLEQLGRTGSASAAAQQQLVKNLKTGMISLPGSKPTKGKGGNVAKAAVEGLTYKQRKTYKDVLGELGYKKPKKGFLGKALYETIAFTGGTASDPLTYATGGTSSVAAKGAAAAARRASVSASTAKGRSLVGILERDVAAGRIKGPAIKERRRAIEREAKAAGREAGRKAARRHLERAPEHEHRKGLTVRFAGMPQRKGKPIAPLVRSTAALSRGIGAAARPITKTKAARRAADKARLRASQTIATIRPPGVTRKEFETVKAIQRESRAQGESHVRRAVTRSNALLGRLGEEERRAVIDAIESGNIAQLKGTARSATLKRRERIRGGVSARKTRQDPDRLYNVALQIRSDVRYLNRVGRRSGLIGGQVGRNVRTREEVAAATGSYVSPRREKIGHAIRQREAKRVSALERTSKAHVESLKKKADEAKARYLDYRAEHPTRSMIPDDPTRKRLKKEADAATNEWKDVQARASQEVSEARAKLHGQRARAVVSRAQAEANAIQLRRLRKERTQREAQGYFPRVGKEELEGSETLRELELQGKKRPPASAGGRQPKVKAGKRREHRKPQAALREGTRRERHAVERFSEDVRAVLSAYGGQVGRGAAARNMNVALAQAMGSKVPRNITRSGLAQLDRDGKQVFRLRRGQLEPMTAENFAQIRRSSIAPELRKPKARGSAAQYVVLPKRIESLAREKGELWGAETGIIAGFDKLQRGWKGLALATPGYLVRNLLGDAFNATVHENPFRLARNFARGQRALNELGRYERAMRKFERAIPKNKRTIKLTDEQADAFARASTSRVQGAPKTEVSAMEVALLAERMGVIRQGRFLELMEEGRKVPRPRGTHAWQDVSKRVEDSTRMATFLGGLQRGLSPREAATRASKIHFDYGDLTSIEKSVFRRALPFYTFTARNVPLQAKSVVTRPAAYAGVQRVREQGRQSAGLPAGYEETLNPYEARQLGLPVKWGDKTVMLSVGSPFTDLNDVTVGAGALARGDALTAGDVGLQRGLDMASVFLKLPLELKSNFSYFYRDQIQHEGEPLTRAPKWAIEVGKRDKKFARLTGLVPDYVPPDGKKTWGWGRKPDYAFRQAQPGPISAITELLGGGVKGANARDMSRWQRIATDVGLRIAPYEGKQVQINGLYDEREKLEAEAQILRRRAGPSGGRISAENTTKRYDEIRERMSQIERELAELGAGSYAQKKQTTAPTGGFAKPSLSGAASGGFTKPR